MTLYDYDAYISDAEPLYLYDWSTTSGFKDSNIHSYSQGKYIQSVFNETKVGETWFQHYESAVASYAITKVESAACDALKDAAISYTFKITDGIPVCKIVKFVAKVTGNFWDLGQNTPSSQAG